MMKQRFGRIEDKFFQLIPKALAFKPIDDIKDFVYSYVLDEKEVNIDHLRENVRSYQELEKTLEGVKNRIENCQRSNATTKQWWIVYNLTGCMNILWHSRIWI